MPSKNVTLMSIFRLVDCPDYPYQTLITRAQLSTENRKIIYKKKNEINICILMNLIAFLAGMVSVRGIWKEECC